MTTTALPLRFAPLICDLTAEDVTSPAPSLLRQSISRIIRCGDTMAFRIAVPPMVIWAVLYSFVEYLI